MKYRKKPVEIEAVHWQPDVTSGVISSFVEIPADARAYERASAYNPWRKRWSVIYSFGWCGGYGFSRFMHV